MAPFSFMEIQMTARATGPFGELNRKARLNSEQYPIEYLQHLVEIGVAEVTIAHRIERPIETKEVQAEKKPLPEKPSSVSRPAQASRKKTAKGSGKAG